MTIKQFLLIIMCGTLLCWAAWGVVLWNIDPFEASVIQFVFFYSSLYLSLSGTIATIAYGMYHFFGDVQVPVFKYVKKSVRNGIIGAGACVALLLAQSWQLLNVWSSLLLILIIAFFISLTYSQRRAI